MPKGVYEHKSGYKRSAECKEKLSAQKQGCLNPMFGKKGEKHHLWTGGRASNGKYVLIYRPDHPYGRKNGYVYEHRLIVESIIGRVLLPSEETHHRDRNKTNNDPRNLMAFANKTAHRKFERGLHVDSSDIVFDGRAYELPQVQ